jgi:hypothetical protein
MYSSILNGETVSAEPSTITIGLSKYPTRNITGVHIKLCPAPPSWFFKFKKTLKIFLVLAILVANVVLINFALKEYRKDQIYYCGAYNRVLNCGMTGTKQNNTDSCKAFLRSCSNWRQSVSIGGSIGQLFLASILLFWLIMLIMYSGLGLLIVTRQKKSSLVFGNVTDKPVLIVPALSFKEYVKLVTAGDPEAFDAKLKETSTPLIEFRDAIESSINELQKT